MAEPGPITEVVGAKQTDSSTPRPSAAVTGDPATSGSPDPPGRTPFDLLGPLPTGTVMLEASAGTGKTFTIAGLVTRYVAEGRARLDQMLVITFGRNATRELRERVRSRLTATRDALTDPETAKSSRDEVVRQLSRGHPDQIRLAQQRLSDAVANFDGATIATTHQFCQQMLAGLGLLADADRDEAFVDDVSDVVRVAVDDLYLRKYRLDHNPDERMPRSIAQKIGGEVVSDSQARLAGLESLAELPTPQAERVRLAAAVRDSVAARLRANRLVTFNDLVTRLASALADPATGELARQRLRDRFQLVLVDEFQDTDPAQWEILRMAFHGHRTLVLIGDPKQSIYAFRGADVYSYLAASEVADSHATLATNYRSDGEVVAGLNELLGGISFGDGRITVRQVAASPEHAGSRVTGPPSSARVTLRVLGQPDQSGQCTSQSVAEARKAVARDVVDHVGQLLQGVVLAQPTRVPPAHPEQPEVGEAEPAGGAESAARPLQPGDIAILVATNLQAAMVQQELEGAGLPAVVNGAAPVFATPAAVQWQTLLTAMERPRPATIRAAALTDFLGRTATELGTIGDQASDEVAVQLKGWGQLLATGSVASMMTAIDIQTQLSARVLARVRGERQLTDLRHIAALLHAYQRRNRAGITALNAWLGERIRLAQDGARETAVELARRLETDAAAIQVLTVHRAKGLEFPVVFVPYGWDRVTMKAEVIRYHDDHGQRVLDVRSPNYPPRARLGLRAAAEDADESLRALYVALTRASSLVVVHWAASYKNTAGSPLHRILHARSQGHPVPRDTYPGGTFPLSALDAMPHVALTLVGRTDARYRWTPPGGQVNELKAAPVTRTVDTTWRRTSFTALTSAAHPGPDRPETTPSGHRDDEPDAPATPPHANAGLAELDGPAPGDAPDPPMPFSLLPTGANFGTLVHSALEYVQTDNPDPRAALRTAVGQALLDHPVAGVGVNALAGALHVAMATPLGPLACGLCLLDIPPADRLCELTFELPLASGGAAATVTGISGRLRAHLPPTDPLRSYPDKLATIAKPDLRGFLTGSIDAVLRVPHPGGTRYLVVDYKTNWLPAASAGRALELAAYHPDRLPEAMTHSHYPLQALLYQVALHRYLRWRLAGYDPQRHLGGILYLFLRGMVGVAPDASSNSYGVFSWRPDPALVTDLSDLLDGTGHV